MREARFTASPRFLPTRDPADRVPASLTCAIALILDFCFTEFKSLGSALQPRGNLTCGELGRGIAILPNGKFARDLASGSRELMLSNWSPHFPDYYTSAPSVTNSC